MSNNTNTISPTIDSNVAESNTALYLLVGFIVVMGVVLFMILDTPSPADSCTQPVNPAYDFSNLTTNVLTMTGFDVQGITCTDPSKTPGVPTACTTEGGPYTVSGCTNPVVTDECIQPVNTAYDFTNASGSMDMNSFNVTGITCTDPNQIPRVPGSCARAGDPYTVSGCESTLCTQPVNDDYDFTNASGSMDMNSFNVTGITCTHLNRPSDTPAVCRAPGDPYYVRGCDTDIRLVGQCGNQPDNIPGCRLRPCVGGYANPYLGCIREPCTTDINTPYPGCIVVPPEFSASCDAGIGFNTFYPLDQQPLDQQTGPIYTFDDTSTLCPITLSRGVVGDVIILGELVEPIIHAISRNGIIINELLENNPRTDYSYGGFVTDGGQNQTLIHFRLQTKSTGDYVLKVTMDTYYAFIKLRFY